MADIKKALDQQVTRGESLGQLVILLIAILGVTQFTNILSARSNPTESTKTSASTGATGATGASGLAGLVGQDGKQGVAGDQGSRGATGVAGLNGLPGDKGVAGATGIPGFLSTAYGQLTATSQEMFIEVPNEWATIPFNVVGPSSNMTVSATSPGTITVQQDGTCQLNLSVYFSSEESDEATFTPTNYRLGIKVNNDAVKPVAATFASASGEFLLSYSEIIDLSANDTVQLYMSSSDTNYRPFANLITIENANAHLMQISD